jgi:hypothetical protein
MIRMGPRFREDDLPRAHSRAEVWIPISIGMTWPRTLCAHAEAWIAISIGMTWLTHLCACAKSIAAAAPAAETAAAARCFLTEINVIVDRRIKRIGVEGHLRSREHVALPGLNACTSADRYSDQHEQTDILHEPLQ